MIKTSQQFDTLAVIQITTSRLLSTLDTLGLSAVSYELH